MTLPDGTEVQMIFPSASGVDEFADWHSYRVRRDGDTIGNYPTLAAVAAYLRNLDAATVRIATIPAMLEAEEAT